MSSSEQLIAQFATSRSEASFRELVQRHIDLVYSTALRSANGDSHLAEDISQIVFADLASKAGGISLETNIAGWLYRHTRFTAAKTIRSETRRRNREEQSVPDPVNPSPDEEVDLAPVLDEALESLTPDDREAILLRFFHSKDFRTVGQKFGLSEDAAQKRVSRALEKLRGIFSQKGILLSAAGLTAALGHQAHAAPSALAHQITSTILITSAASTTSSLFLQNAKMKILVTSAAIIGLATPLLWQSSVISKTKNENSKLRTELNKLASELAAQKNQSDSIQQELARLRSDNKDLQRLRGEIAQLKRVPPPNPASRDAAPKAEAAEGEIENAPRQVTIQARFIELTSEALLELSALNFNFISGNEQSTVLSSEVTSEFLKACEATTGVDLLSAPRVTTLDGRAAQISISQSVEVGGNEVAVGPTVSVVTATAADLSSMNLKIEATLTEFLGLTPAADIKSSPATTSSSEAKASQPLPRFRVRSATQEASITLGQSLLVAMRDDLRKLAEKRLFLLLTPEVMDSAGLPLSPTPARGSGLPAQ